MVMEFFTNKEDIWFSTDDGLAVLREGSPVVDAMDERIRELFPKAYEALCSCYAKSACNIPYYKYLRVRRFCKCNFGVLDHTMEDVDAGVFHFEQVTCPLRGECPLEGVVCMPTMETRLSEAEKRVMRLVCDGLGNQEIAGELYLSPNTVKRHISNAYIKTRTRNRAEFVRYVKDNNIPL